MRTLFLLHEQRLFYFLEPSYLELYLPMKESGLLGETSVYVFQRDVRWLRVLLANQEPAPPVDARNPEPGTAAGTHGDLPVSESGTGGGDDPYLSSLSQLMRHKIMEFRPDLVVNALTWPQECVPPSILQGLRDEFGFALCSVIWDHDESNPLLQDMDREVIAASDLTLVADSYSRWERIAARSGPYADFTNTARTIFLPMVPPPSLFHPQDGIEHEVTISGSSEGYRNEVYQALLERGFAVHRSGGMMPGDAFLEPQDYARALAVSRIVVNTQTMGSRVQLKGRVAQALACGTLLLEQDNAESRRYLQGIPVPTWSSIDELAGQIRHYLDDEAARRAQASAARAAWMQRYSIQGFTSTLLERAQRGRTSRQAGGAPDAGR